MKRNNTNIKRCALTVALLIGFSSLGSCNFEKKNQPIFSLTDVQENKDIELNVKEAKLFSDVARLNLKVLDLNKTFDKSNLKMEIKILARELDKSHVKIQSILNKTAKDKLILLPNQNSILGSIENVKESNSESKKLYLESVSKLLLEEFTLLENLQEATNDVDLRVMAVKIMPLLKSNLNQIKKINHSLILTI